MSGAAGIGSIIGAAFGAIGLVNADAAREKARTANFLELKKAWESEDAAAADALSRGSHAAGLVRQKGSQVAAQQRVAFAANSVIGSSGTAAKLQEATLFAAEDEANTVRANAIAEAMGHAQTAQRYRDERKKQALADMQQQEADVISFIGSAFAGGAGAFGGK